MKQIVKQLLKQPSIWFFSLMILGGVGSVTNASAATPGKTKAARSIASDRGGDEGRLGAACSNDSDCGGANEGAEGCRQIGPDNYCDGFQRYRYGCSNGVCSKSLGICEQCNFHSLPKLPDQCQVDADCAGNNTQVACTMIESTIGNGSPRKCEGTSTVYTRCAQRTQRKVCERSLSPCSGCQF